LFAGVVGDPIKKAKPYPKTLLAIKPPMTTAKRKTRISSSGSSKRSQGPEDNVEMHTVTVTSDDDLVTLEMSKRLPGPRFTEDVARRALMTSIVLSTISIFLILLNLIVLTYLLFSLHHSESTILNNALDMFKNEVYPDALKVVQHKMGHVGCAARTIEDSVQCLCHTIFVTNFGFPEAVCDFDDGLCGFGGVDGIIDTCALDHILEISSSEVVSLIESSGLDDDHF
jgi:hypothetical protein